MSSRPLRILPALFFCFRLTGANGEPAPVETGPKPAETAALNPSSGDEISQGLWWLYHLDYERAHSLFATYAQNHSSDPAGYFYMTATDWWQLAQQFDMK